MAPRGVAVLLHCATCCVILVVEAGVTSLRGRGEVRAERYPHTEEIAVVAILSGLPVVVPDHLKFGNTLLRTTFLQRN